jgi:hypothetical protein
MADHPDDELLSAHLDDEAPDVRPHVVECPACRARLAELRAVAAAVAAPPPAPPQPVLDRAVEAALAGGDESVSAAGDGARLTPLRRSPARRMPPRSWTAAAAAAIALLVAVPVVLRVARPPRDVGQQASTTSGTEAGPVADTPARPPLMGDDLGDQSDPAVVAALVSGALATRAQTAPGAAERHTRAAAQPEGGRTVSGPSTPSGDVPCAAEARAVGQGRLAELLYMGWARWKGIPAVVLVFRSDEPSAGDRQIYVMSRSSCAVLAEPRS